MTENYYRVRPISVGLGMILIFLVSSCSPSVNQKDMTDPHVILYAELMHEVNRFSPAHIWIDEPELGYRTIGIKDEKPDLAARLG